MKSHQGRSRISGVGGSLVLLFLWACGGGSESGSPSSLALSLQDQQLSAALRHAAVGDVLAELARQTGIHVRVEGAAAIERVSVEFTNLPLEEGIKRILQGKNYALTYNEDALHRVGAPKIVAIRVLAART